MYQENIDITTPIDNAIIWRYMDLSKFLDILYRKALYFTRADRLDDPFEGSIPKINVEKFKNDITKNTLYHGIYKTLKPLIKDDNTEWEDIRKSVREFIGINSWNMNKVESSSFWKQYCSGSDGIAIQSTIERLKKCMTNEPEPVYIGQINYIDYSDDEMPVISFLHQFLYKREVFADEKEVRAIVFLNQYDFSTLDPITIETVRKLEYNNLIGYHVSIDPEILIESVILAPSNEEWQKELLQSLINHYKFKLTICPSSLRNKPLY